MLRRTRRVVAVAGPLLTVAVVAALALDAVERGRVAERSVAHTRDVIETADEVLARLVDAETGERGYVMTGREEYLEPYVRAREDVDRSLAELRRLTADNPEQQRRIDVLERVAHVRLARLDSMVALRRASGFDAVRELTVTGVGKAMMDSARAALRAVKAEERSLLEDRRAAARWRTRVTIAVIVLGLLVTLAVALAINRMLLWAAQRQEDAARELAERNARLAEQATELEQQVEEAQALGEELEQTNEELERANEQLQLAAADTAAAGERARRLLAVTTGLSEALTAEQVADVIFREAMTAVGADAGSLALVRAGAGEAHGESRDPVRELEIVRTHGYSRPLTERYRRFPLSPGRPLSDAIIAHAPRLVESLEEWRRAYPVVADETDGMGYEAFAAVPIVSGEHTLGGLSFSFRRAMRFDDATRLFLATLGEQCGLALERARAYEAERRSREASAFLAEASHLLAASLDYETTLRAVAEAAVPRLADWCAVDVVRDPTVAEWPPRLDRVAIVHQDPEKVALGKSVADRYPTDWSADVGMAAVLRRGTSLFVPRITDEMLVGGARDAEHLAILRALQFSSIIVVPLLARGLTLGALTLCTTESGRRYDEADLALARDLAQRAAVAVDNARLHATAQAARTQAEGANEAKSHFLATMSHELRTPLNAIGGYAELMEMGIRGPVTAEQREDLARIQRSQRHLLALINDILNFAKVEAGRVEYQLAEVRLAELLASVGEVIAPQVSVKGLGFEVADGDGVVVRTDPEKARQVLLNLLGNAVKFTPRAGRVVVEVAHGAGRVAVGVRDTGPGIPADQLERIFEPFVQLDRSLTSGHAGAGLGLAISRDLARGMGGDLTVESVPGDGSVFTLTLPRA